MMAGGARVCGALPAKQYIPGPSEDKNEYLDYFKMITVVVLGPMMLSVE
jgi:hypothetical protein